MTWRDLTCGACGAPRTTIDDAMFVACEHCGAVYDAAADRWFDARAQTESFARAHAAAFWGSAAAGRFAQLGAELQRMTPRDADDAVFRAKSEEYFVVYTLVYPDRVPAAVRRTPARRAAWAKQAAHTDLVARTDASVAAALAELNAALAGFGQRDASAAWIVGAARAALDVATRVYTSLQSHPRLVGDYPAPARYYARTTVRTSLLTMLGTLADPDIYPRVAAEVFGDAHGIGEDCTHCGAPLVDRDRAVERCGHCGSVLERSPDDPWIAARVALFRATLRERHQRGELDTYVTALAAFSFVGGAFARAGADRVARYLHQAMPWLPEAALRQAAQLYRTSLAGAELAAFDAALARPWVADPAQRPAPPAPPTDAFEPEAWLAKSRTYWGYAAPSNDPVLAALSIAIVDVLVAQPSAVPPITAALVLRFFDEVLADIPRATWIERLDVAVHGYGDGPAGALVRELAAAVRR